MDMSLMGFGMTITQLLRKVCRYVVPTDDFAGESTRSHLAPHILPACVHMLSTPCMDASLQLALAPWLSSREAAMAVG